MNKIQQPRPGIVLTDGKTAVTVWAPLADKVLYRTVDGQVELSLMRTFFGYWQISSDRVKAGQLYHIVIDGQELPDPTSRAQPEGVHGPSRVVDLSFEWTDQHYQPPGQRELIIYELHVGTFTPLGDFQGVIAKLPYLKDLGITAIEIMPVAQFPGERNWGYDGVFAFAVQHSYGGARGLQQLVNACHDQGIAVVLDVVYNHFGPEGNYLPAFGPYFTDKYQTPWGKAINYDDAWNNGARDFVLDNVRMWFEDFHIDALRLDAVHAIRDFSPRHILQDIRRVTDSLIQQSGRQHYLLVECDLNDRRFLDPLDKGGFAMNAQWLDEFHHALRVTAGEERKGYYAEFDGIKSLAKAYEKAYVFDGNFSEHRHKFFGSSAEGLTGDGFIVFSQNHDQVGNRMLGQRSSVLFTPALQRLMAFAVMVSPYTPLLFMGEEWATTKPFLYFVSHGDETLIEAVRNGRKREFADFHSSGEVPDPQSEQTFEQCILDWEEKDCVRQLSMLSYYKALITLRKENAVLHNMKRQHMTVACFPKEESLILTIHSDTSALLCIMNFSSLEHSFRQNSVENWVKIWDTEDPKWGGTSIVPHYFQKHLTVGPYSGVIFQKTC